jgi:hypothetical protein
MVSTFSHRSRHSGPSRTCVLALVRTWFNAYIDLKASGQRAKQANTNREPNKGRHATVWYGRSELYKDASGIYDDLGGRNDGQLFQGHRAMLWVAD